ncbi:uncharacterized protein LOC131678677 isoform X1 [Topomyia yanbarensis]|uniref:uncharacterized protein LOC131678677 isoform X1 n=1 Tax=Topomyia yanbarensis TaxID=2498891 RepID=UPI00273BDEFC|nr:uncharacterized protein LOC131678677 isoform X1 [Topomyia yanbarensis]
MNIDKDFFNPKTGENHGIFGYNYLKLHRMRDPKWAAGNKMIQYVGITKLCVRDQKLNTLKTILKRKSKQQYMKDIRRKLEDDKVYLHIAKSGNTQLIKNVFQEHWKLQRAYRPLMIEQIVEKMSQRTFSKRKRLDQFNHKLKTLTDCYQKQLMKVSEFQDRTNFVDPKELYEETEAKSYCLKLQHCNTRIRTANAINRAYNASIRIMLKDSIFYNPVLSALQDDLIEQDRFIKKTIGTGLPAMRNIQCLQSEFEELDKRTSKELTDRFKTLLQHRETLNYNNTRVGTLVRRDSDFDIDSSRYDRDTNSMVDLKLQMEEIERITKRIKNAVSCGRPNEIYPRVKQQKHDSQRMKISLQQRERQRNLECIEKELAEVHYDELENDFTYNEMRRISDCKNDQNKITEEKEKQDKLSSYKENLHEISDMLKLSFQHILDVFRNIETEKKSHSAIQVVHDYSEINIPLLNFETAYIKRPSKMENRDFALCISLAKEKIKHLMETFEQAEDDVKDSAFGKDYQYSILKEHHEQDTKNMKNIEKSIMEGMVIEDINVLTRAQIKAVSAQIVAKNTKRDD